MSGSIEKRKATTENWQKSCKLAGDMNIWHLTPDAERDPRRVSEGEPVIIEIGTWPIQPGQAVQVVYEVDHLKGPDTERGSVEAPWRFNRGVNSYWSASLGPFLEGDRVSYAVHGSWAGTDVKTPAYRFDVGPKIFLAILWHQHQPLYKDTSIGRETGKASYTHPWVRLHAIRDYYSMAELVASHPNVHLTVNLTPVMLWQIEDYTERGATDRALELTLKPAARLNAEECEYVLSNFFDAHWHHQIFPHTRYNELFEQREQRRTFSIQDVRDLQMWFNLNPAVDPEGVSRPLDLIEVPTAAHLTQRVIRCCSVSGSGVKPSQETTAPTAGFRFNLAWFAEEFRRADVRLATGKTVSISGFVQKERAYTAADIEEVVDNQYRMARAVIPIHRQMQDRGQIEVSTTPFFHPILPLVADTSRATIDKDDATFPERFAHPEDAEAQVAMAVHTYTRCFGRPPQGMWPAEGAVAQFVVPPFAKAGIRWIASDQAVLKHSGRYGYRAEDPDVACRPYRAEEDQASLSIFFRNTALSDNIGFRYHQYADYRRAAADFINHIKHDLAARLADVGDRIVSVILDGENAWSYYREDARPFLHALYELLDRDREIRTVTFSEYLEGNAARGIKPHPPEKHRKVYDLFTASWIDEYGSAPGPDLGTWIGEPAENHAWNLLGRARSMLDEAGLTPEAAAGALRAVYAAEASDWFWWFGDDQESGNDDEFDDLFRMHLKNAYREAGQDSPLELDRHIVPHALIWTFAHQLTRIQASGRLTIRTNCPGLLTWNIDDGPSHTAPLTPAGGVMAGIRRYHLTLGPFEPYHRSLRFSFRCTHEGCDGRNVCCRQDVFQVEIL